MKLSALSDGEDEDDTPGRMEGSIQLLLIDRQRRPDTLRIGHSHQNHREQNKTTRDAYCKKNGNTGTKSIIRTKKHQEGMNDPKNHRTDLCFGQRNVLMVVALNEEEPSISENVSQLSDGICKDRKAGQNRPDTDPDKNPQRAIKAFLLSIPLRTARTDEDNFSLFFSDPVRIKEDIRAKFSRAGK